MAVSIPYVQARRITCCMCDRPFVYVLGGQTGGNGGSWAGAAAGVVPIAGVSLPGRATLREITHKVRTIGDLALAEFAGEALCPHCSCWQLFMYATKARSTNWPLLVASPFLAIVPAVTFFLIFPWFRKFAILVWIGVTVFLLTHAERQARAPQKPPNVGDDEDPRSFTDEEFEEWLEACRREESDPVMRWALACKLASSADPLLCSLGLLDLTGEDRHPDLGTDRRLSYLMEHGAQLLHSKLIQSHP